MYFTGLTNQYSEMCRKCVHLVRMDVALTVMTLSRFGFNIRQNFMTWPQLTGRYQFLVSGLWLNLTQVDIDSGCKAEMTKVTLVFHRESERSV